MNYYERHIGDYLKDTAHLSLLEHGIYTRLLDLYYTREVGLAQSEVVRLLGVRSKDERAALGVVLQEFFVLQGSTYMQPRCDREILRFKERQAKARRSADARWHPDAVLGAGAAHAGADAAGMRSHSGGIAPTPQYPVPSNQTPPPNPRAGAAAPSGALSPFDQFWQAYPRKVAKPAAQHAFDAAGLSPEQLACMLHDIAQRQHDTEWQKASGQYIPKPSSYLHERRWEDEATSPGPAILPGAI